MKTLVLLFDCKTSVTLVYALMLCYGHCVSIARADWGFVKSRINNLSIIKTVALWEGVNYVNSS